MSLTTTEREVKARLDAAEALAERCYREKRDFTPAEAQEIEQVVADAKAVRKWRDEQNKRVADDAALVEQLKALSIPMTVDEARRMRDAAITGSDEVTYDAAEWFAASPDVVAKSVVSQLRTGGHGLKSLNPAGSIAFDTRLPGAPLPRPYAALWQLVPHRTVRTGEVSYLRQTVRENNASVVVPGAVKPTSVVSVEKVTATLRTIATLSEALARSLFEDDESLSSFVGTELMSAVLSAVDDEIASGDGTGEHFDGILTTSGTQAQPFDTSPITTIRKAITRLEQINVRPTAIAVNPADFEAIELSQGSDGQYVIDGVPTTDGKRQLFGVAIATATAVPVGKAIVANWNGAVLVDRGNGSLTWSEHNSDDWSRNLVRWRCELRAWLEILQPRLFVIADLTA